MALALALALALNLALALTLALAVALADLKSFCSKGDTNLDLGSCSHHQIHLGVRCSMCYSVCCSVCVIWAPVCITHSHHQRETERGGVGGEVE